MDSPYSTATWPFRIAIIVPAADVAAANAYAPIVTGNSADAEGSYSIPLSADGAAPATHYALCMGVTGEWLATLQAALPAFAGVAYYRWDANTRLLVATSSENALAIVGTTWGWSESLADAGLSVIAPEVQHGNITG